MHSGEPGFIFGRETHAEQILHSGPRDSHQVRYVVSV